MTPLQLLDSDGENQAVRWFLACYGGGGNKTIGTMKLHLEMSGFEGCWPEWCNTEPAGAHLTKGGAQLWIRHLFNLEVQQAVTSGERAGLIAGHREQAQKWLDVGNGSASAIFQKTADMLEADAIEIEGWKADQKENLKNQCDLHEALQARQVPMTDGEIYTAYISATNQTLRAQDERLALAFARAIEQHYGIKNI